MLDCKVMENSVRYQRLETAVHSVYIDWLFDKDDSVARKEVEQAGRELLLNYEGGDIRDGKGSAREDEVRRLVGVARRLGLGERNSDLQAEMRECVRGEEIDSLP